MGCCQPVHTASSMTPRLHLSDHIKEVSESVSEEEQQFFQDSSIEAQYLKNKQDRVSSFSKQNPFIKKSSTTCIIDQKQNHLPSLKQLSLKSAQSSSNSLKPQSNRKKFEFIHPQQELGCKGSLDSQGKPYMDSQVIQNLKISSVMFKENQQGSLSNFFGQQNDSRPFQSHNNTRSKSKPFSAKLEKLECLGDTERQMRDLHQKIDTMIIKFDKTDRSFTQVFMQQLQVSPKEQQMQQKQHSFHNSRQEILEQKLVDQALSDLWDQSIEEDEENQKHSKCEDKTEYQVKKQHQKQKLHQNIKQTAVHQEFQEKNLPGFQPSDLKLRLNEGEKEAEQEISTQNQPLSECGLSDPSRFLNDSLITERRNQKQTFYEYLNKIHTVNQTKRFKKWTELNRQAYLIKQSQILQLENSKTNQLMAAVLTAVKNFSQAQGINLISYKENHGKTKTDQQTGLKFYHNGLKRLYPFQDTSNNSIIEKLKGIFSQLLRLQQQFSLSHILYNLTGWLPEEILVAQLSSCEGVFQRLSSNFEQGNTLITFSSFESQFVKPIFYVLKLINLEEKTLTIYKFSNEKDQDMRQVCLQQLEVTVSWQVFIEMIDSINVNWNPLIYDYVWRSQNILVQDKGSGTLCDLDPEYINGSSNQYLLKIPPNSQDVEVRIFIEQHFEYPSHQNSDILLELYDYGGVRINNSTDCVRQITKDCVVYSDVLIFEASADKNEYILVVRRKNSQYKHPIIHYSISAHSFYEVGFRQLPSPVLLEEKVLDTYLQLSHTGYGINSPYFLHNYYMMLDVPQGLQLKIFSQLPGENSFELNLISNPDRQEQLTRLNLQTILTDIACSDEFVGRGYLDIQTQSKYYFLVISNHTPVKGPLKFCFQILKNIPKSLSIQQSSDLKIKSQDSLIAWKEKFFFLQTSLQKIVKWLPTHSGPRKRLKSNTISDYQPFMVFEEFFNNPFIDYEIKSKGKYQFCIVNESYRKQFDQIVQVEEKKQLQPPTLSLAILRTEQTKSHFQIVWDDAFYVPFGFGFWTKILQLDSGIYRFVFPKMEKEFSQGRFSIYQIK